jgi:hypothetical protein
MTEDELIELVKFGGGGHANGATGKTDYYLKDDRAQWIINLVRWQTLLECIDTLEQYETAECVSLVDRLRSKLNESEDGDSPDDIDSEIDGLNYFADL